MKSNLFLPHISTVVEDDVHYVEHSDNGLALFLAQYYSFSKKERAQIKYDYTNAHRPLLLWKYVVRTNYFS